MREVYSPRLWPAKREGLTPVSAKSTLRIAILTVKIAGWVLKVNFNSDSGPSKQSWER
jgi:hypothetical protein